MFIKNPLKHFSSPVACLSAVLIAAAIIYGVLIRVPYIGTLSHWGHQWLSASTWIFVHNWLTDGFWNDWGIMIKTPASPIRPDLISREPYVSYPSGAPTVIFLLKSLLPMVSTLTISHVFNMVNQCIIALILARCVWLLTPTGHYTRSVFSTLAALTYLLHPQVLYYHSMVFFADQAVLMPLSFVLLCETILRTHNSAHVKHIQRWQALFITLACFMEWLGVLAAFILLFFRIVVPVEPGQSMLRRIHASSGWLLAGPLFVIAIWLGQVYIADGWQDMAERASMRTDGFSFFSPYALSVFFSLNPLFGHMDRQDAIMLALSFLYMLYYFIRYRSHPLFTIALISMLIPASHSFLLPNHVIAHSFSVLKYMMPLSLIAYGLLPLCLLEQCNTHIPNEKRLRLSKHLLTCLFILLWLALNIPAHLTWKKEHPRYFVYHKQIAEWLQQNAGYNDVFVTHDLPITSLPPQSIAMSGHEIHAFKTKKEARMRIKSLPDDVHLYAVASLRDMNNCHPPQDAIIKRITERKRPYYIISLGSPQRLSSWKRCLIEP